MLVLQRRMRERIIVEAEGKQMTIHVQGIQDGKVRLAFDDPTQFFKVNRSEIIEHPRSKVPDGRPF